MSDILIKCEECEKPFVFSNGEQRFYKKKGYIFPKRCKECRNHRNNKYPSNLGIKTSSFFSSEQTYSSAEVKGGLSVEHRYLIKCDEDNAYLIIDAKSKMAKITHNQNEASLFINKTKAFEICKRISEERSKEFHLVCVSWYEQLRYA